MAANGDHGGADLRCGGMAKMQGCKSPPLPTYLRITAFIRCRGSAFQFLCVYDCADRGLSGFLGFRVSGIPEIRFAAIPLLALSGFAKIWL
jgi:hypothetical protein